MSWKLSHQYKYDNDWEAVLCVNNATLACTNFVQNWYECHTSMLQVFYEDLMSLRQQINL